MRKTSYVVTFIAVFIVLVIVSVLSTPIHTSLGSPTLKNILSARLPDWFARNLCFNRSPYLTPTLKARHDL